MTMIKFVTQYVAPFMAGAFLAAATIANGPFVAIALILLGGGCAYLSFPPGGRWVRRFAGVPA